VTITIKLAPTPDGEWTAAGSTWQAAAPGQNRNTLLLAAGGASAAQALGVLLHVNGGALEDAAEGERRYGEWAANHMTLQGHAWRSPSGRMHVACIQDAGRHGAACGERVEEALKAAAGRAWPEWRVTGVRPGGASTGHSAAWLVDLERI
jgi:hypothetical protein